MSSISSLFQSINLVFNVKGNPLSRSHVIPRMKARYDPGTCVNQSNRSSFTEWQEISMVKGGMVFNLSMIARVKSVPLV